MKNKYGINKIYTIGTSKGGWASLYYGILLNANKIISGVPQYYIGDYLSNNDYHIKLLRGIVGEEKNKDSINNKLKDIIIKDNIKNIEFIVHYSDMEHTYDEHIKYLLEDLKKAEAKLTCDVEKYLNHDEVGNYFILLLKEIFNQKK